MESFYGAGGFAGAVARYLVDAEVSQRFASFPWGTLVVNVSGSFLVGLLFALITELRRCRPSCADRC